MINFLLAIFLQYTLNEHIIFKYIYVFHTFSAFFKGESTYKTNQEINSQCN